MHNIQKQRKKIPELEIEDLKKKKKKKRRNKDGTNI